MAQDRVTIAFDKNETEQKMFEWIKEKGFIIGKSSFIKQIIYNAMMEEEKNKK